MFIRSFCSKFTLLCSLSAACIPALHAQSTDADLVSRLKGKPLYLRGCWNKDNLHFDSTGKLIDKANRITITLCGFDLEGIQLKKDKLVVDGERVGLEFHGDKMSRVKLAVGDPHRPERETIHVEIDAPADGDYTPALDAIFVNDLADMVPTLPFWWQPYAQKHFVQNVAATSTNPNAEQQPKRSGGGLKPPVLLKSKEPEFNNSARLLKYSGKSLINVHVEPDGSVSHLSIVWPLGMGLDESALAAVQTYRFKPAMENGKPVMVELNIEVNFQIF